ncbi:TonB-dependent receptor SusC [Polaribacter huanghezhanensis]|uniref:TonB-dependent receptor n=1 Tax=Polaribacter huanghezhanensis TaxID=1354726 RepID=UPI0026478047|nr:TonB-dependent receptor [Polaribacter huanghezhanensis]WKD85563.1 TonB-dependent receptor SusC [Polaribacter huanghezhanensis]
MKKLIIVFVFLSQLISAQSKGTVKGILTDAESNNEPLPFVNVFIKGSTVGQTTDFDGNYSLNIAAGKYTLVFSFVGYQTIEKQIDVKDKETLVVNQKLSAKAGVTLNEVKIQGTINRAKVSAILLDQKKAIAIKTTIGAQELESKGVSDLATAVTKATGISKQEGSNNIFVRGLGDRYNSTTLNGLPIPSNNPSRKNITLDLFSTDIVQKIDINKIYNGTIYGDFGGANINIVSKEHVGKPSMEIGIGSGTNSNLSGNFYLQDGPGFSGFYKNNYPANALTGYNFTTSLDNVSKTPIATRISVKGGKKYQIGEEGNLNLFGTASFSSGYKFKEGIQRGSVNAQGLAYTDYTFKAYDYNTNTTAMLNAAYKVNANNTYKFSSLFINSSSQSLDEYSGVINVFDNASNGGGFVKRATFDKTALFVNQFLGNHKIGDKITVDWGISYNHINNVIPDRRQNMLVPKDNNDPTGVKVVSDLTSSDNHRFFQELFEDEVSANFSTSYLFAKDKEEVYKGKFTVGYSGRFKKVDFKATQFNFRINRNTVQPIVDPSNLNAYFNQANLTNKFFKIETFRGDASTANALDPQTYFGNQFINGGFLEAQYKFTPKFTAVLGVRLEHLYQDISWKTSLDPAGNKSTFTKFEFLPNATFKYEVNDKNNLKLAASKSYTLPQYKERAPFQFEEVTQIKFGNPDLNLSTNYNVDLRWEYFPKREEVISITGFGKIIKNPINEVIVASATNDISYVNTGKQATVFGAEFEIRKNIFSLENDKETAVLKNKLSAGFNASYMYSKQDFNRFKVINETNLNVNFTNKEGRLTGASDLILNADVTYKKDFSKTANLLATISYNYFSDRVYAIGSAGKGDLIDKGTGSLDIILKSELSKKIKLGFSLKNLLNPSIKRVQEIQNVEVLSFKNGIKGSLSLTYKLD